MKNLNQKYKRASIESASREKLLLMFYESAMSSVKKSIIALEEKKIEEKCKNISKAYAILIELNNTLDHSLGDEISVHLEQLYMFMMESLIQANIKDDKKRLENVLKILSTLYEGWVGAIGKLKEKKKLLSQT